MNTYEVRDRTGQLFAFEVESVYITISMIATVLNSAHDVSDIRVRKLFSSNSDTHIEFTYMGKAFIVWEPYADNSRYWIGPKDVTDEQIDVSALQSVFHQYRPFFVIKILGDLVSLKFLSPLRRWFKPNQRNK